jgi:hypothetical protein
MRDLKYILLVLSAILLPVVCTSGMDRLDALSQIESHNNDRAIGPQREVSRYQILPVFWEQANVVWRPADPATARIVVNWIMQGRFREFEARYHRAPNDFEYYILWHRPSCYIGRPVPRHITSAETERGRRFANLCQADG